MENKENPASIPCLTMLLRCQHDSSTVPSRFMTAALRFTTVELLILTMRPRFDTVLVRFKPVVPRRPIRVVFLMNRDKSEWIGTESGCQGYPDSSRMPTNGHDYTCGAVTNEPDSATVELRFRPRPQSTTIHPECFKRFKIVVALSGRFPNRQDSSRYYYDSRRCLYGATTNHADASRFDKSRVNRSSTGAKIVNV